MNDLQLKVLKWIGDGCPDGVMEGYVHKRVAIALQDRRLVKISKKAGSWHATIAGAGRHFLAHGDFPEGHWKQRSPSQLHSQGTPGIERPVVTPSPKPTMSPRSLRSAPPAEQLIAELLANGGELRTGKDANTYEYRQKVDAAIRFRMVPEGKLLTTETVWGKGWGNSMLIIRMVDQPGWITLPSASIPVPDRCGALIR